MKYLALILLIMSAISSAKPIVLCIENINNQPYFGIEQNDGVFIEFINIMNSQSELQIELVQRPWKRCLRNVEQGLFDGAFAVIYTQQRDKLFSYPKTAGGQLDKSKAIWQASYPVFVHKESELQWNGDNFSQVGIKVAAPLGYIVSDKLEQIKNLSMSNIAPEKGLKLLAMQRLDAYVIELSIGDKIIQSNNLTSAVTTLATPFLIRDWYLVLSNNFVQLSPQTAAQLWELLAQVREQNGQRLYQKYMQQD